ncbi:MAG: 50S ribosomal protein L9 [Candidatus Omnitrophica bacterium]|nr:50S ribosomal protein L9 [Candidatus Omnitrophota bacterium]MBU4589692.1 50S ribosomal protein L9 [Candidatus Omnitrophota bacterium]
MKVILIEDVKSLGSMGEIVQVKDGHARNFLFPKKLAKPATDSNLKIVDEIKKKKLLAASKEKKAAEGLKEKLSLASCTVSVEAGDDDKLFGSVTNQDIASALEQEGFSIDKRKIIMEEPVKILGVYHVSIKLHPEVTGEVKVWVVKK